MKWSLVGIMVWCLWFLFFVGYEFLADVNTKKDIPFLTQTVCRYLPWWITLPFIVWLFIHFATRYWSTTYMQSLRPLG
jgi:hypothetical protein